MTTNFLIYNFTWILNLGYYWVIIIVRPNLYYFYYNSVSKIDSETNQYGY